MIEEKYLRKIKHSRWRKKIKPHAMDENNKRG